MGDINKLSGYTAEKRSTRIESDVNQVTDQRTRASEKHAATTHAATPEQHEYEREETKAQAHEAVTLYLLSCGTTAVQESAGCTAHATPHTGQPVVSLPSNPAET